MYGNREGSWRTDRFWPFRAVPPKIGFVKFDIRRFLFPSESAQRTFLRIGRAHTDGARFSEQETVAQSATLDRSANPSFAILLSQCRDERRHMTPRLWH